ncbi:TonB-dependent receptor [Sphingomonas sp. Root241]|nr:TonB-dependent receptor [Sphingomonas sp. Root241]
MGTAPAYAQDTDGQATTAAEPTVDQAQETTEAPGETIVVTGSRIRRPNLDSPVPVTSIGGEEFFQTGTTSVGDVLNELPALTSTFSQSNSTRFLGTSGLNLLDLRGLGPQRTLVLVNGRRHVAGDILNNAVSPDVNAMPTDLIERVDIVTGGSSAIYGSDAIAGVVNFVLKDNFEGFQIRGQGGLSDDSDAPDYYISALAGKNFAGGRGNIALNLEYAHQGDFYASDREEYRNNNGFVVVDNDPFGSPNGSDGKPDRVFYKNIRSGSYANGGMFLGNSCGPYYCSYHFLPNGNLVPVTGTKVGASSIGSFIGGDGDNFRDGTQLGLRPRQDRYSANLIAHFEISPAFVPFIEAKYVRSEVLGSASGPFFFNGGVTGSPREVFYTDNPYLSAQARNFLNDYYGVAPGTSQPFYFNENATSLTNRQESLKRDTYRLVGGVRGEFGSNWSYEVSANYGRFDEENKILGNVNLQRFLLAIDAVDQGLVQNGVANGNIVCRATVDPTARVALETAANPTFAGAQLAADVAACRPVNFFGVNNVSDAARGYLLQDSIANGRITQFVANAFVSGDSSKWFELPGGPVGISFGAEYRRETASYTQDEFTQAGLTFYNSIPTFDPPSFEVKEVFGELSVPILKDVPFFNSLTLSGAVRYADYKGSTGNVFAYNGSVEWSPVRDLRFRGNYSRSVRAPTLVDLYTPFGQNYAFVTDPCSLDNLGEGTATREANCRAAGVPAGYNFEYVQTLGFLSGGNPDLEAETSDSYTVGFVLQPRWIRGLSLTVDFYDITVNNTISSVGAQDILDNCYDAADLNNQYCSLFQRYTGAGTGPRGEITGQVLENNLRAGPLNYAKLKVRGIDAEIGYRGAIGNIGNLSTRAIYSHNFRNDSYLDPADPGRRDQQLGELGYPKDEAQWSLDLQTGPITLGYKMRYVGKMTVAPWEATHTVQGRAPEDADYSDITEYPSTFYHNIRVQMDVGKSYNLYLGVDNLLDTVPPLGTTGAGFGSGIYDNVGRFLYAGFVAKF